MARSVKKGPYVEEGLARKVQRAVETGSRIVAMCSVSQGVGLASCLPKTALASDLATDAYIVKRRK